MSVENVCMQIVKMTVVAYFKCYPHIVLLLQEEFPNCIDIA